MREVTLAPDLPKSHCRIVFRRIIFATLNFIRCLIKIPEYCFFLTILTDTFCFERTIGAIFYFAVICFSGALRIVITIFDTVSSRTIIDVFLFIVSIVGWLKALLICINFLPRNICLYSSLIHICVYFGAVISFVRTNCLCFKTIFIDLCFDSFGMNRTVIDVSGRDKNICDQAVLAITGLVTQIVKSVWLSGTVHISAFRVSRTYFDLLSLRCLFFFVVFF